MDADALAVFRQPLSEPGKGDFSAPLSGSGFRGIVCLPDCGFPFVLIGAPSTIFPFTIIEWVAEIWKLSVVSPAFRT